MSCFQATKSYSDKTLFQNLSFSLHSGDRVGLVGPNGAGKSTFLSALLKEAELDAGTIAQQKSLITHSVEQSPSYSKDLTIREAFLVSLKKSHKGGGKISDNELESIADELSLGRLDEKISSLSGGGIKKVEISAAFLSDAQVVFFDEPTNHLDLKAILWLENKLKKASFAWVCISHDRYFLDKVAKTFMEISPVYEDKFLQIKGNYQEFLRKKANYLAEQKNRQQTLTNILRKEEKWLKTSPRARTTKAKYRIDQAHDMQKDLRDISKREVKEIDSINFLHTQKKSKKIITLKGISHAFGAKKIFQDFGLEVSLGHKIGLLGLNGSGKSTLLKIIAGELSADAGTVDRALNLRVSYFDQDRKLLETQESVKSFLCHEGDSVVYNDRSIHISSWLKRFGFSFEKKDAIVSSLSGGEKAKLFIAKLLLEPCDLLILDEPTNDLDIVSLELLEEGLASFSGSLVLVSHDRYFLESVCDKFLGIGGISGVSSYLSLTSWLDSLIPPKKKKVERNLEASKKRVAAKNPKLSYMEERELSVIEEEIAQAEDKLTQLKHEISLPENLSSHEKLIALSSDLDAAQKSLDELYERWHFLEEKKALSVSKL